MKLVLYFGYTVYPGATCSNAYLEALKKKYTHRKTTQTDVFRFP